MTPAEVAQLLKALTIKDLRIQARSRGLSPAGSVETLRERLQENMVSTGDYSLKHEDGSDMAVVKVVAGVPSKLDDEGLQNNYSRPGGQQNVGNYMTDRSSSRVLAPPGGGSQIVFGDDGDGKKGNNHGNNYQRPDGQNVGNFLGDRPSSRVLAAPGGGSQITFG